MSTQVSSSNAIDKVGNLHVLVIDDNADTARALMSVLRNRTDIGKIDYCETIQIANLTATFDTIHLIFIDIFESPVQASLDFIQSIRDRFPKIIFCLYSAAKNLREMSGVNDAWKHRLEHYFQLSKVSSSGLLLIRLEQLMVDIKEDVLRAKALDRLARINTKIENINLDSNSDVKQELQEATSLAVEAIESGKSERHRILNWLPSDEVQNLTTDTLGQANNAIKVASNTNLAILAVGASVLIASLIMTYFVRDWMSVSFGAFGIAGVITALVMNPLKTIGSNARRIVQVQIAYLAFLSQLSILHGGSEKLNAIEISDRLGKETAAIQETLHRYFNE